MWGSLIALTHLIYELIGIILAIKWFPTIVWKPKGTDTQLVHISGNSRVLMAIDERGRLLECDLSY